LALFALKNGDFNGKTWENHDNSSNRNGDCHGGHFFMEMWPFLGTLGISSKWYSVAGYSVKLPAKIHQILGIDHR
jgi:hypothetical protein